MENQLRWNCIPNEKERKQEWYLAIINSSIKELNRLYCRTLKQLAPIEEFVERNGKVNGLCYKIINVLTETTPKQVNFDKIFQGRRTEDRELYEREKTGLDGLEAYIVRSLTH